MSHSKSRVSHKVALSDVSIGRLRSRPSEDPARPVSDLESTFTSTLNSYKPSRARLVRQRAPDSLTAVPCSGGPLQQLPRSLSATKTSKGTEEKQPTPAKERVTAGLSSVHSEAFFAKLRLPQPDNSRRKPNKESLNSTTIAKEDLSSTLNQSFAVVPHSVSPRSDAIESATSLKSVESRLLREIRFQGKEADFSQEIELYSHIFSQVIALNPSCKSLLVQIKAKYETWLRTLTDREHRSTSKHQSDVIHLQNSLLQAMEENSLLVKKVEKLALDKAELVRSRENCQRKCSQYQEKLYEVANTRLDEFPPTEEAWKLLTSELIAYKSWKKKILQELKTSQSKEKRLNELIQAMKKRGYPIDEVYNSDVKPHRQTTSTRSADSSDSELLPATTYPKPVPQLRLEELDRQISSVSEVSTESAVPSRRKTTGKESNSDSGKSGGKVVPLLTLPKIADETEGFHQEFMAKYDEFSESWRQLIDAQKH